MCEHSRQYRVHIEEMHKKMLPSEGCEGSFGRAGAVVNATGSVGLLARFSMFVAVRRKKYVVFGVRFEQIHDASLPL